MSYSSEHIQIMDMRFSAHVTVAEFEQWLSQVERFFLKKQHFVLVMQTDIGTEFPEEYRQLQAAWYKKYKQLFFQFCLGTDPVLSRGRSTGNGDAQSNAD